MVSCGLSSAWAWQGRGNSLQTPRCLFQEGASPACSQGPPTHYLFPEALVPRCAGEAGAGLPTGLQGPVQLQQGPGSQGLGQGLELAQPLASELVDGLGTLGTLQLLHECD